MFWIPILFGVLMAMVSGCVTTPDQSVVGDVPVVIATLDLFAQNEQPKNKKSWLGDWEFRRDRLDLVDAGLRDIRPDIMMFQNALKRTGSSSEGDQLILGAGALARYEWRDVLIESMKESGEDRLLAVAVPKPFDLKLATGDGERSYWQLGSDGHAAMFLLVGNGDPILIVDVLMPSRRDQVGLWYSFIQERVNERLASKQVCANRVIVGGYLPIDQDSRRAKEFVEVLGLRDTASGFCQNVDRCQTATASNGMFLMTRGDEGASQADRVLVHQTAQVLNASLVFSNSMESDQYLEQYGLSRIWPAQRFGWMARVRLKACP